MSPRISLAGWVEGTIGDVIEPIASIDPGAAPHALIDYIDIGCIDSERGVVATPKSVLGMHAPSRARQDVREGDVLFSTVRPYLRAIAAVPRLQSPVGSTGFCVLRPAVGIDRRYLLHWVRSTEFIDGVLPLQRGSSYPAVRDVDVHAQPLPLPPTAEQQRIADRLDELLGGIEGAAAELVGAKRKLALYRQSLLKSAVEGTLTREAACWPTVSVANLPGLEMANGRSVPSHESGAKVLRLTCIRQGRVDLSQFKHGAWSQTEAAPFAVQEGDLLVVRGNGSLGLVGRAGLVPPCSEAIAYPDTLIRVRADPSVVRPAWLACVWESHPVRTHLERRARTSAGIYKISQPDIASAQIPLPPIEQQDEALAALDAALMPLATVEAELVAAERMASAQRQNILRAAFSGHLVPQDPNDEPASVLLERIRAERHASPQASKRKPGRPARVAA